MKKIFCIGMLLCCGAMVFSSRAMAAQKQWGVETGYVTHRFIPQYSYVSGRTNSNFTNRAYGLGLSIFGRYDLELPSSRFVLPIQCLVGINNAKWSLTTGEPSDIKYSLPYNYDISLLPTLHLTDQWDTFLEVGVGQGYIKEKKESLVSSTYNFSKWTTNYILGCGFSWMINEQISAYIKYRYVKYNSISYQTYLANGAQVETISDQPSTKALNIGVMVKI